MKRTILLFMGLLFASSSLQLVAMEEPPKTEIVDIIKNDNVKVLDQMIRAKEIDPSKVDIKITKFHTGFASPLDVAVEFCSVKSVELLSHVTESNELILQALENALRLRNADAMKDRDPQCRLQIVDLLLNKARELDLDIQPALGFALGSAIFWTSSDAAMEYVQFLLSIGADRTYRFARGESLIEVLQDQIKNYNGLFAKKIAAGDPATFEQLKRFQDLIILLRTYAPDLKTRIALFTLNQVREGKLKKEDFDQLPRDVIELIAKLADVDPEANKAWIAIGMPAYPLPPEEQEGIEKTSKSSDD